METMECPSCGSPQITRITSSEFRCESCSTLLTVPLVTIPNQLDQENLCPACGFVNPGNTSVCKNCQGELSGGSLATSTGPMVREVVYQPGGRNMNKIEVVRWMRNRFQSSLKEAKLMSETTTVIAANVPRLKADQIKKTLENWGGVVLFEMEQ